MAFKRLGVYILLSILVVLLLGLIYFFWRWKHYVVTDAVFVQAERLVYLSFPKVNGKLIKLNKREGDIVEKDEVLAEIEPLDYIARLKGLEAEKKRISSEQEALYFTKEKLIKEIELRKEQVRREIKSLEEQRQAQMARIEALKARLSLIKKDLKRAENLFKEGLIAQQTFESKETEEKELRYQIQGEEAQLKAINEKIQAMNKELLRIENERYTVKNLQSKIEALSQQEKALVGQIKEAQLYLEYTQLKSPLRGLIAKKFHSEGDVVAPGEPIYSLIDPESFYVLVLLEETKLSGVVKGAKAKIKLDAYPGKEWKGEVDEILPATAATFALVPRDISAGEFTKLAQRVPVKIKIIEGDKSLLRVGLGGQIEIKKIQK